MWGLSRNVRLPYCIGVFVEIPHDATQGKNFEVLIFPLLTNMYYKIIA